jgi:antiviral helicase SKI2
MVDSLTSSLQHLRLSVSQIDPAAYNARLEAEENDTLEGVRPRQKVKKDLQNLKSELEEEFLTPSSRFSSDWLNRLQRSVPLVCPSSLITGVSA